MLEVYAEAFASETPVLTDTDGEALVREMLDAGRSWSLRDLATDFEGRDVLLIGTSRDAVTPVALHHEPLVAAFSNAGRLRHAILASDHALSDQRVNLTTRVVDFVLDRL